MAAPADYWDSVDLKALAAGGLVREDVMDKIWDISSIPLPFTDLVGSDVANNDYTEWTIDELPAPDITNAVVSGSDVSGSDAAGGSRVGNHCQTSDKVVAVTHRSQNVNVVGRSNEMAYQLMMRQRALRRDVEAMAMLNNASVADDNNTTAGEAGGFDAWLETSTSNGATGSDGGFNTTTKVVDAATPGTARGLTETILSAQVESAYNENGNVTALMSVPGIIKRLARFLFGAATVATPTANVKGDGGGSDQTSQGYINVMVTDFGTTMELIPNRLQQYTASNEATVFGIDPALVALAFLSGYSTDPLAKLGHSWRTLLHVDWTVKVYNEKAHFGIRAIDDATAVVA